MHALHSDTPMYLAISLKEYSPVLGQTQCLPPRQIVSHRVSAIYHADCSKCLAIYRERRGRQCLWGLYSPAKLAIISLWVNLADKQVERHTQHDPPLLTSLAISGKESICTKECAVSSRQV